MQILKTISYLKKNDVLFVDRNSDALHIFGEVTKPGVYFPNIGLFFNRINFYRWYE